MRSLLLVTADSDAGLGRAMTAGADVIVVDLGDSRQPIARTALRLRAAGFVAQNRGAARLFVRVGALSSGLTAGDLDTVVPSHPHGIVLPRATGGADVTRLAAMLRPREAMAGVDDGAIAVVAMAADTPAGLFALGGYAGASARLAGIGWDANDLAAGLGAAGGFTDAARLARSLTLAGAAAAGVAAIDTPFTGDRTGLAPEADRARADGFTGKFARDPDQVAVINRAFAPVAPSS